MQRAGGGGWAAHTTTLPTSPQSSRSTQKKNKISAWEGTCIRMPNACVPSTDGSSLDGRVCTGRRARCGPGGRVECPG